MRSYPLKDFNISFTGFEKIEVEKKATGTIEYSKDLKNIITIHVDSKNNFLIIEGAHPGSVTKTKSISIKSSSCEGLSFEPQTAKFIGIEDIRAGSADLTKHKTDRFIYDLKKATVEIHNKDPKPLCVLQSDNGYQYVKHPDCP